MAVELERLIHDLTYENQQYLNYIEKEENHIEEIEKSIAKTENEVQRYQEEAPQLDESIKHFHKQFISNRENVESLKSTISVLSRHEEALQHKLEQKKASIKQEQEKDTEILIHYKNVLAEHSELYETFDYVQRYREKEVKVKKLQDMHSESQKQLQEMHMKIRKATSKQETKFTPYEDRNSFFVALAQKFESSFQLKEKVDTKQEVCKQIEQRITIETNQIEELKKAVILKEEQRKVEKRETMKNQEEQKKLILNEQLEQQNVNKLQHPSKQTHSFVQEGQHEMTEKPGVFRIPLSPAPSLPVRRYKSPPKLFIPVGKSSLNRIGKTLDIQKVGIASAVCKEQNARPSVLPKSPPPNSHMAPMMPALTSPPPPSPLLSWAAPPTPPSQSLLRHVQEVQMQRKLNLELSPTVQVEGRIVRSTTNLQLAVDQTQQTPTQRAPVAEVPLPMCPVVPRPVVSQTPANSVEMTSQRSPFKACISQNVQVVAMQLSPTQIIATPTLTSVVSPTSSPQDNPVPPASITPTRPIAPAAPCSQETPSPISLDLICKPTASPCHTPCSNKVTPLRPTTPVTPIEDSPYDLDKQMSKIQMLSVKSPGFGFSFTNRPMFETEAQPECSPGDTGFNMLMFGGGDEHLSADKADGSPRKGAVPTLGLFGQGDAPCGSDESFKFASPSPGASESPVGFHFGSPATNNVTSPPDAEIFSMFGSTPVAAGGSSDNSFTFSFGNTETAEEKSSFSMF